MPSYYSLLTTIGAAKIADALANNTTVNLTQIALGDGNDLPVNPTVNTTELVRQVHIANINSVLVNPQNTNWVNIDLAIPAGVGGWTIREFLVLDDAGDAIFVGNLSAQPKPVIGEGTAVDLFLRFIVEVSSTDAITMIIDPNLVTATQQWVYELYIPLSKQGHYEDSSGINADMLDGQHASYFQPLIEQGEGGLFDADMLDGRHAAAFLEFKGEYLDDLDLLLTSGIYSCNNTYSPEILNYPSLESGILTVTTKNQSGDEIIFQEFRDQTNGKIFYREKNGTNAFSDWLNYQPAGNYQAAGSCLEFKGEYLGDLDLLLTNGIYTCNQFGQAAIDNHYPSTSSGIITVTTKTQDGVVIVFQEFRNQVLATVHVRTKEAAFNFSDWLNYQPAGDYAASNHNHDNVYSKLGVGQTWQNLTESRAINATYTNNTGKPIQVAIYFTASDAGGHMEVLINGVSMFLTYGASGSTRGSFSFIVPEGDSYKLQPYDGAGHVMQFWSELR